MKSRFLTKGEKKDVAAAALQVLRGDHPGCVITITVADETDERGVPQYTYTVTPAPSSAGSAKPESH